MQQWNIKSLNIYMYHESPYLLVRILVNLRVLPAYSVYRTSVLGVNVTVQTGKADQADIGKPRKLIHSNAWFPWRLGIRWSERHQRLFTARRGAVQTHTQIIPLFLPGENHWWIINWQTGLLFVWKCTLLWPVVINKTIVQQNRIKSLHHNENPLKQKRRCSNIPGRLHQSPPPKWPILCRVGR